jgi:hypothetical protein
MEDYSGFWIALFIWDMIMATLTILKTYKTQELYLFPKRISLVSVIFRDGKYLSLSLASTFNETAISIQALCILCALIPFLFLNYSMKFKALTSRILATSSLANVLSTMVQLFLY